MKEFYDLLNQGVKKIDGQFLGVQNNVDCLLAATCTLVEDVCAFNIDYTKSLVKKKDDDDTLLKGIKSSINTFKEKLQKVALDSSSLLSDEHVTKAVY